MSIVFLFLLAYLGWCNGFQWPAYHSIGISAMQKLEVRHRFRLLLKPQVGEVIPAQLDRIDNASKDPIAVFSVSVSSILV